MMATRSAIVAPRAAAIAAADLASAVLALGLTLTLRHGLVGGLDFADEHLVELGGLAIFFPVSFWALGLYEDRRLPGREAGLSRAAVRIGAGVLVGCLAVYAGLSYDLKRPGLLEFAAAVFTAMALARVGYAAAARKDLIGPRWLLVGTRDEAARVLRLLARRPSLGVHVLGRIALDQDRGRLDGGGCPVLGTAADLEEVAIAHRADRIVVGRRLDPELKRRLRPLRYRGVAVSDFVSLHEELLQEIPLGDIDDGWLFLAASQSSRWHARWAKRVTDLVIAGVLFVPFAALFPFLALLIKASSPGPALFRQERVGLGGRPFQVLKLRTMRQDAEKLSGPVWSTEDDPRITPVGRYLRKFRLDELPQLVNVLRGEMSLVGPRPERPVFVEKLEKTVPFYAERLLVPPGVTGWAQVMAPYASSVEDSRRKLQFDLYYAKNMSLALDALIVLKTVKTMVCGHEREQNGIVAGAQLAPAPEEREPPASKAANS